MCMYVSFCHSGSTACVNPCMSLASGGSHEDEPGSFLWQLDSKRMEQRSNSQVMMRTGKKEAPERNLPQQICIVFVVATGSVTGSCHVTLPNMEF